MIYTYSQDGGAARRSGWQLGWRDLFPKDKSLNPKHWNLNLTWNPKKALKVKSYSKHGLKKKNNIKKKKTWNPKQIQKSWSHDKLLAPAWYTYAYLHRPLQKKPAPGYMEVWNLIFFVLPKAENVYINSWEKAMAGDDPLQSNHR